MMMTRSDSQLVILGACMAVAGCAADPAATHVFVRDPHQVWVEAASNNGEQIVLPPGEGLHGVRIREGDAETRGILSYATLFREPSGGITVDDRLCAPWPTSPLSAAGELRVMKRAGEAPYVSDGLTVRIAYLCRGPQGADGSGPAQSEIDFVTPWTNVREIHIVKGEVPEVAASSTHPALQRQEWLQP
jgi:hypothetical protein